MSKNEQARAFAALMVALGATARECERAWDTVRVEDVPPSPYLAILQARRVLADVRGERRSLLPDPAQS